MQENGTEHRRPDPPNRAHRGDVGVILQRKHALATTYHHTERTLSTTEHPVPLIRHDPVSRALRARSFGAPSRNSAHVPFEKRLSRATSVHLQTEQRDTRATGQPNNPVRWRQRRPSRTRALARQPNQRPFLLNLDPTQVPRASLAYTLARPKLKLGLGDSSRGICRIRDGLDGRKRKQTCGRSGFGVLFL